MARLAVGTITAWFACILRQPAKTTPQSVQSFDVPGLVAAIVQRGEVRRVLPWGGLQGLLEGMGSTHPFGSPMQFRPGSPQHALNALPWAPVRPSHIAQHPLGKQQLSAVLSHFVMQAS